MEFVDTHCHLQFDKLSAGLDGVIARAGGAGVNRMICVGTSLEDSVRAVEFAGKFDGIWAAAGAHPHEAEKVLKDKNAAGRLADFINRPKVVAVGEIGLDFYKDYVPRLTQEKAFRSQLEASIGSKLPYIFHVRDAWADFWRIFDEYENLRGVVHSFSSGTKQLAAALDRGLYIGLNGIMTFTKDHAQLEAAKQVPADKLVLETDAPFLTPAPKRDEICEPRHVAATAGFLAGLRDESIEELSKTTTDNAVRLFGLE